MLAKASDRTITGDIVSELMGLYDLDGDGVVQFSEFVKAMNKNCLE